MGKFKKLFENYMDNHGDKPLIECPMEVQLFACGMWLGRRASQKDYESHLDKLQTMMAEYYEEELGEEAKFTKIRQ